MVFAMSADGRLTVDITFYTGEIELYVAGREAFLTVIAKEAEFRLGGAGGIGPYEYSCRPADGNVSPFVFTASEL